MPLRPTRLGVRGRRAEPRPVTETPGLTQEGSSGLPVDRAPEPHELQTGSEPGPDGACDACGHPDAALPGAPSACESHPSQAAAPRHARLPTCTPVGGGGSAPGGLEQTSGLTLRERRVQANLNGRDAILMPGCPGAPRGPAANPVTGIAARSRQRVQFTPSQSSLTEVVEGFEDAELETGTSNECGSACQAGSMRGSGAGCGEAGVVGVEGGPPGGTMACSPPPENPRRLMSFGSFSFHRESEASDSSFSWSLLTSGSELLDMVSSYLPGFPTSRPSTPCSSSPTHRLPPSPRSLARTVSAEMCSSGGDAASSAPGGGQLGSAAPPLPGQNGEPAVLAPYATIGSCAIPTLPTLVLPGRKPPPIRPPGIEEQARNGHNPLRTRSSFVTSRMSFSPAQSCQLAQRTVPMPN
jgi:hypothetical protein